MRLLKPKREEAEKTGQNVPNSEPGRVLGYVRQSTDTQVEQNRESAGLQETAIRAAAKRAGTDEITVLVEGGGTRGSSASGLRIDQRRELRTIIQEVKADKVRAIAVWSVSRLFRPKWLTEVEIFMQTLAKHNVKLLTDGQDYDFRRDNDRFIFRILAWQAGKENEDRTRLLSGANAQAAARGDYRGGGVSVG